jgi:two-component sensor histidine kinase
VIWAAESHRRLLAQLRAEEGARQLRNYELPHRIRNILASVQAIIRQSLRNRGDILEVLDARVTALVATHDLLVRSDSHVVSLREILAREFSPYGLWRLDVKGEQVECPSAVVVARRLMFHELTTSAV